MTVQHRYKPSMDERVAAFRREHKRKESKRFYPVAGGAMAAIIALPLLGYAFVSLCLMMIFIGFAIGSVLAHKQGMEDEKDLLEAIYGPDFEINAELGKVYRESRLN